MKKTLHSPRTIQRFVGHYPVIAQEDVGGGYWVSCPTLEGCYSQGDTLDEALDNIREAIALCLEDEPAMVRKEAPQVSLHLVHV